MLGTGFLQDILALFEANPNDFEEAKNMCGQEEFGI